MDTSAAYWAGVIFGALFVGTVLGLIPFFLGRKWDQRTLGVTALVCCIVVHYFTGLLGSIPACVVFVVIEVVIHQKRNKAKIDQSAPLSASEKEYADVKKDVKYCVNCGKQITRNDRVCPYCGHQQP